MRKSPASVGTALPPAVELDIVWRGGAFPGFARAEFGAHKQVRSAGVGRAKRLAGGLLVRAQGTGAQFVGVLHTRIVRDDIHLRLPESADARRTSKGRARAP
jgi:hypothetical protein